jgi:hypothetical protein
MSVVAGVEPVVMASQTLESGPFYRDEMSKLLNKSEHSEMTELTTYMASKVRATKALGGLVALT